jgi:hypothetical protein
VASVACHEGAQVRHAIDATELQPRQDNGLKVRPAFADAVPHDFADGRDCAGVGLAASFRDGYGSSKPDLVIGGHFFFSRSEATA